jgi:hypothetical protein
MCKEKLLMLNGYLIHVSSFKLCIYVIYVQVFKLFFFSALKLVKFFLALPEILFY